MAKGFNPDEYVDVAERIGHFYETYPDGRLSSDSWSIANVGDKAFVVCEARAYRTHDDPLPGVGLAWEPLPGQTPFTKNSELMVCQTSAWGRAIAALGFATKHIASANEVANRQSNGQVLNGTSNVNVSALNRTLEDMGIASRKKFLAKELGTDVANVDTLDLAAEAIEAWAKETGLIDPVQELIERASKETA